MPQRHHPTVASWFYCLQENGKFLCSNKGACMQDFHSFNATSFSHALLKQNKRLLWPIYQNMAVEILEFFRSLSQQAMFIWGWCFNHITSVLWHLFFGNCNGYPASSVHQRPHSPRFTRERKLRFGNTMQEKERGNT